MGMLKSSTKPMKPMMQMMGNLLEMSRQVLAYSGGCGFAVLLARSAPVPGEEDEEVIFRADCKLWKLVAWLEQLLNQAMAILQMR